GALRQLQLVCPSQQARYRRAAWTEGWTTAGVLLPAGIVAVRRDRMVHALERAGPEAQRPGGCAAAVSRDTIAAAADANRLRHLEGSRDRRHLPGRRAHLESRRLRRS